MLCCLIFQIQGIAVDTFRGLSQAVMPTLSNVPITFGTKNQAWMKVDQEEWHHHNGNEKENLKFEDCVPWTDVTSFASDCSRICLPIILQQIYEENINQPKCHNGSDHICMWKLFEQVIHSTHTKSMTQCLQPKHNVEYKSKVQLVMGNALNVKKTSEVDFIITYNSFKKTIHEEILVYDKSGIVSQLGGVVSLFIGISIFPLFSDCLDFIQKKIM